MKNLKHRYNPDYFYGQAKEYLSTVDPEDALSWYNHPCTKSLVSSLEGDVAGIIIMWLGGAYSSEDSSDLTAQRVAKARGMAQAANDVIDAIRNIRKLSIRGENVSHGDETLHTP